MNLIPIAQDAKYAIVEVSEDSSSIINEGLIIVKKNISMSDEIMYLNDCICMDVLTKEKNINIIDIWSQSVRSITVKKSVDYGNHVVGLIIPKKRILSIQMVDDLCNFPNTKKWSSLTREQAEAICDSDMLKEERKAEEDNKKLFKQVERVLKVDIASIEAKKEWNKLSWLTRNTTNRDEFIARYVEKNTDNMIPTEFYKKLDEAGILRE